MKVALENKKPHYDKAWAFNEHIRTIAITKSLPFYHSSVGTYVHRIRDGVIHLWDGKATHASYHMWCGMIGFIGGRANKHKHAKLLPEPPAGEVVCATCEGRAVGTGLFGTPKIADHVVKFSPHYLRNME